MARFYRSFETASADFRMGFKLFLYSVFFGIIFMLFVDVLIYKNINNRFTSIGLPGSTFKNYLFTNLIVKKFDFLSKHMNILPEKLYRDKLKWKKMKRINYNKNIETLFASFPERKKEILKNSIKDLKRYFKLGFLLIPIFSIFFITIFYFLSKKMKSTKFVRGKKKLKFLNLKEKIEEDLKDEKYALNILGIKFPVDVELSRFIVAGMTRVGKSVLLSQIMNEIMKRQKKFKLNEKSIIYDYSGDYVKAFYRPNEDYLFSPYDQRCLEWRLFNEIEQYKDIDMICKSLFAPPANISDDKAIWYIWAENVFRMILLHLEIERISKGKDHITNLEILEFCNLPLSNMKSKLEDSLPPVERDGIAFIDATGENQDRSKSVISVMKSRILFLRDVKDGDFSFRKYIRSSENKNLFILNIQKFELIFSPLLTFVIDVMAREILSLDSVINPMERIIHLFLDEFGRLEKLSSIFAYITNSAKYGGRLWLGVQDYGEVIDKYGKNLIRTLKNNFQTKVILRTIDSETSQDHAKDLGQTENLRIFDSRQMSPESIGDRVSMNEQKDKDFLFLPSEISMLPKLSGILDVAGYGNSNIKIERKFFKGKNPYFIERKVFVKDIYYKYQEDIAKDLAKIDLQKKQKKLNMKMKKLNTLREE